MSECRRYRHRGPQQDRSLSQLLVFYRVGGDNAFPKVNKFRIGLPPVRVLTRVTLQLLPTQEAGTFAPEDVNVTTVEGATKPTLWAALQHRGIAGDAGGQLLSPVQNLVGTRAAPLSVPTDDALWGYQFSVEGYAPQEIFGRFVVSVISANSGDWRVSVSYFSVDPLSDAEWGEAVSFMTLRMLDDDMESEATAGE